MSEQYTITVPALGLDGEWTYPRVGEMSALRHEKTGEVIYDIAFDFPVGATELVAFAQGSDLPKADDSDDDDVVFSGSAFSAKHHNRPPAGAM